MKPFIHMSVTLFLLPLAAFAQEASDLTLRGPEAFSRIENDAERSVAIFREMGKVIESPRCMNCHPRGDSPMQKDGVPHMPPVVRGADGHGAPAMECSTCHSDAPVPFEASDRSVPGHPDWHLAPVSMGWQGLPLGEVCVQMLDPGRNGGLSLDELIHHNGEDGLVGSGWTPGPGRTPAPGTQELFGALTRAWIETGSACPSS
ncbi:Isoquinoline 1-oxidoreductase subunit [Frigidibacter sp. MR17.24]|uniref:Isoquinoline 1-oxidoreductase subunit n=1 Tax=Frigidibacter sp. MR17.24 TaxID=3127345 RepID=UPI003012DF2D